MEEIIVMSKGQFIDTVELAVVKAIDKVRPLLLKAASEYISTAEVELRFGIPKRRLENWRRQGVGPAYVEHDKLILYRVSDVDHFLHDFRVDPQI